MSAPVIGTLFVDTDLTVDIPIDDMGGNAFVRVDYAVPPGGSEPAADSHLWRTLDTIETESTVTTPAQVYGSTVWVRASGRTSAGERVSPYATDSIAIDDVFQVTSATVTVSATGEATVTFTVTGDAARILWEVHAVGEDPGSLANSDDVDATDGAYTINAVVDLGEAITVEVQAWEVWDSTHETAEGEQGLSVTLTTARATPDVPPLVIRLLETYEHTLEAVDAGAYLRCSHPSAFALIVPEDATLTFAVGTTFQVEQTDAGQVTVTPETSEPTINALGSQLSTSGQYAVCWLTKVAANTWTWYGDVAS